MRRSLTAIGLAGLAGAWLYARRRALIGRALGLRPAEHAVAVERDVPVPMPDGATLYADHFRPATRGSYPTILIRTPYGRPSEAGPLGPLLSDAPSLFAERGYHVIVQGARGRFRSEGAFEPFLREREDGLATLDWVAAQPWFDGSLGMWGLSYYGYTQWAIAADAPPFLKAIVPVITTARFSEAFYPKGAFSLESSLRWATYLRETEAGRGLGLAAVARQLSPRREAAIRAALRGPFAQADVAATGGPAPYFRRWLAEAGPGQPYWRDVDRHRSLGRISAAVHLVAGWYDIFLPQQLADYSDLLATGRSPYLTVLPRHHTAPAIAYEAVREGLWWFDAHLKGRQELLERRAVRLALMGSREWHEMDFWPPPARNARLFLRAGGHLADAPGPGEPSRYTFDPRDPTPAVGGPVLSPAGGPRDQRPVEARPDVLTFTSEPLPADLDVIGHVRLELFARSSLPHTDFVGRLCDVAPDGRSINVCEGLLRVAPGVGEPLPGGGLRLEIDMWATARRFRAGHRIRLHVCSGAHPRWGVNSGDGRPLADGAPAGLVAEQTIFHDPDRPSALVLPVVSEETRRAMAGGTLP